MPVTHNIEWLRRAEAVILEVERWMKNFLLANQECHIEAELGKYAGLIVKSVSIQNRPPYNSHAPEGGHKRYLRGGPNDFVRNIQLIVDCYYENWDNRNNREEKRFGFNPPTLMGDTMLKHGWGSEAHKRDRIDDYDQGY